MYSSHRVLSILQKIHINLCLLRCVCGVDLIFKGNKLALFKRVLFSCQVPLHVPTMDKFMPSDMKMLKNPQ